MDSTIWERRECVGAEVEDSLILLDLDTLVYHSLNRTAAEIWEKLETPCNSEEIAGELSSRYGIDPDRCRASVDRLLAQLSAKGLVKPHEPQQSSQ